MNGARLGIAIMVLVTLGGALDTLIVRMLAGDVHPVMIGFTRACFGFAALVPLLIRRPSILRSEARFSHVLRAALKLASLIALFAALQSAPLATVTAIGFASPVFVVAGAWLFLSEVPGPWRMAGLGIGFGGILVILGPALGLSQGVALSLALISALLTATIQLMLKVMGRADSALTLVAWNLMVSIPLAAVPAAFFWSWPTPEQWGLLALQGVIGTLCQLGVTRALQLADASLVAPVDFLRLPFVALVGWVVFAELPPLSTWIGGAMVFAAVMILSVAARRRTVILPEG